MGVVNAIVLLMWVGVLSDGCKCPCMVGGDHAIGEVVVSVAMCAHTSLVVWGLARWVCVWHLICSAKSCGRLLLSHSGQCGGLVQILSVDRL